MGDIKKVRECTGYRGQFIGHTWKAGCRWATMMCAYQFSREKSEYTTEEPPGQCDLCAREEARERTRTKRLETRYEAAGRKAPWQSDC